MMAAIKYGLYEMAGWAKYGAIGFGCFVAGETYGNPYWAWPVPVALIGVGVLAAFLLACAENLLDPWRWEN